MKLLSSTPLADWSGCTDFFFLECSSRGDTRSGARVVTQLGLRSHKGFMVCSGSIGVGSPGPTETDRAGGERIHESRPVEEMKITTRCVCQQGSPSSCDGARLGFFHSCTPQQHKNPESECGDLIIPDASGSPKKKTEEL